MRPIVPSLSMLALTLLASCDPFGSETGLRNAVAMPWCGPADGPATAIIVASEPIASPLQPPFPHTAIMIWQGSNTIAGHTFSVTSDAASASYRSGPNQIESATGGTVTITSVNPAVVGQASIRFPSRFLTLNFNAPIVPSGILCN